MVYLVESNDNNLMEMVSEFIEKEYGVNKWDCYEILQKMYVSAKETGQQYRLVNWCRRVLTSNRLVPFINLNLLLRKGV